MTFRGRTVVRETAGKARGEPKQRKTIAYPESATDEAVAHGAAPAQVLDVVADVSQNRGSETRQFMKKYSS